MQFGIVLSIWQRLAGDCAEHLITGSVSPWSPPSSAAGASPSRRALGSRTAAASSLSRAGQDKGGDNCSESRSEAVQQASPLPCCDKSIPTPGSCLGSWGGSCCGPSVPLPLAPPSAEEHGAYPHGGLPVPSPGSLLPRA